MNHRKMSTRLLSVLLALILCLGILPTAAFAEDSDTRTQQTIDQSVDTSTTQVIGILETDRETYENTAFIHDDPAWTTDDEGVTYRKFVFNSGKQKVYYSNPCSEYIQGLIDSAKVAVDASGVEYAAQPNLSYAGSDTKYSDRVTDNRVYRWFYGDEGPYPDLVDSATRYMLISGDFGRERVYRIIGVINSSADPGTHSHIGVLVPEMPATAEATGTKAHYKCNCNRLFGDEACTNEVTADELVIPKLAPTLLEGNNGKFIKDSTTGLSFKSSAALDDLVSVGVDGTVIDESNYTKASGSTLITLKPEYLNTLSDGEHTLTIASNTGAVKANFKVEANAPTDSDGDTPATPGDQNPDTGDNSHMPFWVILLLVSGMGIVITTVYSRKKRTTR